MPSEEEGDPEEGGSVNWGPVMQSLNDHSWDSLHKHNVYICNFFCFVFINSLGHEFVMFTTLSEIPQCPMGK